MTNQEMTEILATVARLTFQFAKTTPETPHEYTTRKAENEVDYVRLYQAIKDHGHWEKWGKYRYLYPGDGWRYWNMGPPQWSRILNRARVNGDNEIVLERARAAGRLA